MRTEVEVGAVCDAFELGPLRPGKAEAILDIDSALGVVAELLFGMLEEAHVLGVEAEVDVPVPTLLHPVLVPFLIGAGLDEELHLHLLKLAGAEDEVARRDLIAKALAGLADAERRLLARSVHDVEVIDEDALRGLGTQVVHRTRVVDGANGRAEHAIEVAWLGEVTLVAAVGAGDVGKAVGGRLAVLVLVGLDEVVSTPALVALLALGQWIGERCDVAGRLPHLRREDDRGVKADDVLAAAHHVLPPLAAHILFELHTERAVVPCRAAAPVDLRGRKHEAPALAQVDDGLDTIGGHGRAPFITQKRSAPHPAGCRRMGRVYERRSSTERAVSSSIVSKMA